MPGTTEAMSDATTNSDTTQSGTAAPDVLRSIDPATGEEVGTYPVTTDQEVERRLARSHEAFGPWAAAGFDDRAEVLRRAADLLRTRSDALARLMALEMGKPLAAGRAEVEKCAWVCEYYATEAEGLLADIGRPSSHSRAATVHRPLGAVLAVMPWNFPFWQVFRFAAPTLMAGNTGLLKHASNVSGCALAIQSILDDAGAPDGVFSSLLVRSDRIEDLIADDRVRAVTLTGSEPAGRAVGAAAGANLKPSVLELGGSDAYVVLSDAEVENAASICAASRLTNSGQSCIAAKRFVVVDDVHDRFVEAMAAELSAARVGNPLDDGVDVGPQARTDLRDDLHRQLTASVDAGATVVLGGEVPEGPGAFYPPSLLVGVVPGMAAFDEELFGPVAAVVRAEDTGRAIDLANASRFGLGASVFTADHELGERIAADRLDAGCCFVNAAVASDPRLPFGGVGVSGYGRELAELGIRAFVNAKTVAVA